MADLRHLPVTFLTLIVLMALASSQILVYGNETRPWGVERIRAYCVWDNNFDMTVDEGANAGQNVIIAVIDTGIDYWVNGQGNKHYHSDMAANVLGGRGFRYWGGRVEEREDHEDWNGHGTHVAGTIAAVDNTIGVIGTAPKTKIYALKVFSQDYREVVAAINYAVNTLGAHIITMSLGYLDNYADLRQACDNAYARGRLLIAMAGNDGGSLRYPAKYDSVIAVGAVDENLYRPSWSNFGSELEFVAPGVDINSTWLDESYRLNTGTSMAVPHVTATVALIWSSKIDPDYDFNQDGIWSNTEVREKLKHLALDLGPPGRDNEYGYGLINAWATNQRPLADINVDYVVNLLDAVMVMNAFWSSPGDSNWDPRADINIDNIVDMTDATIVSVNFGEVDP